MTQSEELNTKTIIRRIVGYTVGKIIDEKMPFNQQSDFIDESTEKIMHHVSQAISLAKAEGLIELDDVVHKSRSKKETLDYIDSKLKSLKR